MKITGETITHVANLARLNISEQEKERLTKEMGNILAYVDKLNELDTSNVEPTAHVMPIKNVLREDEIKESYQRDKILANATSQDEGCFKVPKIVE